MSKYIDADALMQQRPEYLKVVAWMPLPEPPKMDGGSE